MGKSRLSCMFLIQEYGYFTILYISWLEAYAMCASQYFESESVLWLHVREAIRKKNICQFGLFPNCLEPPLSTLLSFLDAFEELFVYQILYKLGFSKISNVSHYPPFSLENVQTKKEKCHLSHVMRHMSCVTWTKWWRLSVEGLLSTGPTHLVSEKTPFHN